MSEQTPDLRGQTQPYEAMGFAASARGETMPYTPENNPALKKPLGPTAHEQAAAGPPVTVNITSDNTNILDSVTAAASQQMPENRVVPSVTGPLKGYGEMGPDQHWPVDKRISALEKLASDLKANQWLPDPFQRIFFARFTDALALSSGPFQEQCYLSGAFVDFGGGRTGSSLPADGTSSPSGVGDLVIMYEVLDPAAGGYAYRWQAFERTVLVTDLEPVTAALDPGIGVDTGLYKAGIVSGGVSCNITSATNVFSPPSGLVPASLNAFVFNGVEGGTGGTSTGGKNSHMLGGISDDGANALFYGIFVGQIIGIVDSGDADFGGSFVVMISSYPPPAFPVLCDKDGGSDGDRTTKATWTYTVKNQNLETLGTAMTPLRPRPLGKLVYATSNLEPNGLAFLLFTGDDGWDYVLWDAGEVPNYVTHQVLNGAGGGFLTYDDILAPNDVATTPSPIPDPSTIMGQQTFADATARAAAAPNYVGQMATQRDTSTLYISTGTSAGDWA